MCGLSCFAHCFRFESDLYAQSWGISCPDCLHRVRQPTARALGAPAPAFRIFFFFFALWASLCMGISDNGARQGPNRREKIHFEP